MKENFWKKLNKPFFILAPMEDVTDIVFRKVVAKAASPDIYFTEFTSTDSFVHEEGIKSLRGRLKFDEDEKPIVAHIWGDRKSTRLNSSHVRISYAVFCLKKKKKKIKK